jgi:hypothetical protein
VIEQDFGLRGILTANKLAKFRELLPGRCAGGTTRTERARASVVRKASALVDRIVAS